MSSLGIFDKGTKTYQKVADLSKPAAIDSAMSDTSTNAVQNKVVKKYVDDGVKSSKKLQTYKQGSTTETYGDDYPIYAQWRDGSHVKMKCDNYTVETDYATSAGSASTVNGHTVNSDVPSGAKFTDTVYDDTGIRNEINTLKKSVSDGKTTVANAITAKGVTTATDATFTTMANNISQIESGGYKYASGTVSSPNVSGMGSVPIASTGLGNINVMQIIAIYTQNTYNINAPMFYIDELYAYAIAGTTLLSQPTYCNMALHNGNFVYMPPGSNFYISLSHSNGTIYANTKFNIRISNALSMKWIIFYT